RPRASPQRRRENRTRTECPALRAAFTVSSPIPLLAPMIRTVATTIMLLVGPPSSRHVRHSQPHRKIRGRLERIRAILRKTGQLPLKTNSQKVFYVCAVRRSLAERRFTSVALRQQVGTSPGAEPWSSSLWAFSADQ